MKLEIKDIIDKHKGSNAIVVGHGPSLDHHRNKLQEYKDNGYLLFDCNEWYVFHKVIPSYWITANSEYNIFDFYTSINDTKIPYFYADTVDLTPRDTVDNLLNFDYLPYDQRHYNNKPCEATEEELRIYPNRLKCCEHMIKDRITIQEELQKYTKHTTYYNICDTVILQSIAFPILMGCKNIYLVGVDLDYRNGYAKTTSEILVPQVNHNLWAERTVPMLGVINDSAKNIGVNIINTNRDSHFDIIKIGDIPA